MSSRRDITALIVTIVTALAAVGPAKATSLHFLFDGANIAIEDSQFDQWGLLLVDASGPSPNLSQIDVVPLDDDPLNPGLACYTPLSTSIPNLLPTEASSSTTAWAPADSNSSTNTW